MLAELKRTETPCFHEQNPAVPLLRRGFVEGLGTFLLALAATGAAGSALLGRAFATAGALVALIVAFGAVSGGHFNPLITILQWLAGERSRRCTVVYCLWQIGGALAAAWITTRYFLPSSSSRTETSSSIFFLSELACSAALIIVVFACTRSGNRTTAPFAVGAWLASAIVAAPSSSVANPAMALAVAVMAGFAGTDIVHALLTSIVEGCGALLALLLVSVAYPGRVDHA